MKAGKIRSKKNKDLAGPAAAAVASSNKEASSGGASREIKAETERALPVEVQQHDPSEMIIEALLNLQAEVVAEPKPAPVDEHEESTSQEVVSSCADHVKTEEERGQEEQVITEEPRRDAEKGKAVIEEKFIPEESAEIGRAHV